MSEKRENVQSTEYHLRKAHEHINSAERYAEGTGDKGLHKRVTKLREDVTETRKEIATKIDPKKG